MVDMSDYLPTFADLAGAKLPEGVDLDGVSFASRIRGDGAAPRKWVFAEHRGKSFVRTRDWKLYNDGRLFNMKTDGEERSPIQPKDDDDASTAARERLRAMHPVLRDASQ